MDIPVFIKSPEIKIAIIEDDEDLSDILAQRLKMEGYLTFQIYSGVEAIASVIRENPTIVLLDWILPGITGEEICKGLRNHGFRNYIIMLTGKKNDASRIRAYEYGASDFIEKPFNMAILLAILRNKIRFIGQSQQNLEYKFQDMIYYPQIIMVLKEGMRIELTVIENLILTYLFQHPNKLISKKELESNIWDTEEKGRSRSLDMHMMRLRKKIEDNPKWPRIILTLKGKGIIFKDSK